MTVNEQTRAHVLDALQYLKEAHAALCVGDVRSADRKLIVAEFTAAEARRALATPDPTPETPNPTP